MFKKLRTGILMIAILAVVSMAFTDYYTWVLTQTDLKIDQAMAEGMAIEFVAAAEAQGFRDPCANPAFLSTSADVSITSDTQIITGTTGRVIYVCGFYFTFKGSGGDTFRVTSGTGSVCATSLEQMSGLYGVGTNGSPTEVFIGNGARSVMRSYNPGDHICIDVAGVAPSVQGFVDFILAAP